jgi:PLP dependent protein
MPGLSILTDFSAQEAGWKKVQSVIAHRALCLAVTKKQQALAIEALFHLGQKAFAENYCQEAIEKIKKLSHCAIEWHFIGAIQSNKTKQIATHFDWVQSIDRLKIAKALSKDRADHVRPLNVCIQVNVSNEPTKSGVLFDDVLTLAKEIQDLEHITLRGLMAIPLSSDDPLEQSAAFDAMKQCFDELNANGFALDTLSMGMSNDYALAIEHGSTMCRIGRAIFGERDA